MKSNADACHSAPMAMRGRLPGRAERWLAWSRSVEPRGYAARFDLRGLSEAVARQINNNGGGSWIMVTPRYLGVGAGIPTTTAARLLSALSTSGLLVLRERGRGAMPSRWTTGRLPRDGASESVPEFEPFWSNTYGIGYRARSVHQAMVLSSDLDDLSRMLTLTPKVVRADLLKLADQGLAERVNTSWSVTGMPVSAAKAWQPARDKYVRALDQVRLRETSAPTERPTRKGGA